MITTVTCQELENLIAKEHPFWYAQSVHEMSEKYLETIDESLAPSLTALIKTGECIDYHHGEYSLYLIQSLRHNCSFLEAILLMDEYIKDPLYGKARIQRR